MHVDAGVKNNGKRGFQRAILVGGTVYPKREKIFEIEAGDKTNNEAEILAILYGVIWYHKTKKDFVLNIYSDSQLAVNAVNSKWDISKKRLGKIATRVKNLMTPDIHVMWRRRDTNIAGQYIEKKYKL